VGVLRRRAARARGGRGPDDRTRIKTPSEYPWRAIASLQILAPDGQLFLGTGWFIGPRTLVTAGHCVFIHEQQGRYRDWARAIRVMPGRDGTNLPFGSRRQHPVPHGRRVGARQGLALRLRRDHPAEPPRRSGRHLRRRHVQRRRAAGQGREHLRLPGRQAGRRGRDAWHDAREILSVDGHQIHYKVDTWGGQSGSAVFVVRDGTRYAVGVHAYGDSYFGNSATRITPDVNANLSAWRQ
jgi:V8-like Glu-specific endopeptidase